MTTHRVRSYLFRIATSTTQPLMMGLFLFTSATCNSESASQEDVKPYLIFDGTQSPDGRYAVAWGLPKDPDVWATVSRFEREHSAGTKLTEEGSKQADEIFQSVIGVAQDVENYMVDVRDGKIIRKLDCPRAPGVTADRELEPDYWRAAGGHPNRHDLEVIWSRAGDLVLVNHTYRWDCVTFCAALIRDGKAALLLDLNKKLGEAALNFIVKSLPRGYSKNDLNVSFSDTEQLGEFKFWTHAEVGAGRSPEVGGGGAIYFTLTPVRENGLMLKVLDVHWAKEKAGEIPGTKEHALAKAGRHLNFAYAALRRKLDANAKEALRKEEHEWLAEGDKIDDQFKRAEFIEMRASELEKRTPAHLLSPSKE
jgi:hypothetical protein